jgi:hypothetical protein
MNLVPRHSERSRRKAGQIWLRKKERKEKVLALRVRYKMGRLEIAGVFDYPPSSLCFA